MDLSIIIVSWNVIELLKKCITSLYQNTRGIDFEVLVVDNHSTDGSPEMLRKMTYRHLSLIINNKNLGFAKANNQAIKKSKGDFILLLNPDTEIIDNSLKQMLEFMKRHPDCGILGPKIIGEDGKIQFSVRRFPQLTSQILILLKCHHLFPNLSSLKHYFATDLDYNKAREVEQVMGACFLIRRKVIETIGLFDENFYLWFEEVDFCKRVKNTGFKIFYTPLVRVKHRGGQSFNQILSLSKQRIFNRSMRYYFKKHHHWWQWLVLLLLEPVSLVLTVVSQIVTNKITTHTVD